MTTYNTGNPIGSTDARDLYDNAQNLDNFANGTAASYTDRLGVSRRSLAGIDSAADNVLNSIGYSVPVAYTSGISLTLTSQTVEYNGVIYAPKSSALPFTTSSWGTDSAKFRAIQVTDADLITYNPAGTGAVATTVQSKLRGLGFVNVTDFHGANDAAKINAAITFVAGNGGGQVVSDLPHAITSPILMKSGVHLKLTNTLTTSGMTAYNPGLDAAVLFSGESLSTTTLSAQASEGDVSISVASASGISAGDMLIVELSVDFGGASVGEGIDSHLCKVLSVAGTTITIDSPIPKTFPVSNSTVRKVALIENASAYVQKIIGAPYHGFMLKWARACTFHGEVNPIGKNAFYIHRSFGNAIQNIIAKNPVSTESPMGYGFLIDYGSADNIVENCYFEDVRECSTGHNARRNIIRNNTIIRPVDNGLNVHGLGEMDTVFEGNRILNGVQYGIAIGLTVGSGGKALCRRTVVRNNTIYKCANYAIREVQFSDTNTCDTIIEGNVIRSNAATSIYISGSGTATDNINTIVRNNKVISSGGRGIELETVSVANAVVEGNAILSSVNDGIIINSARTGNIVRNNKITSPGGYGIRELQTVDNTLSDSEISGNTITSSGNTAILLNASGTNRIRSVVKNNVIKSVGGASGRGIELTLSGVVECVVDSNLIDTTVSDGIIFNGAGDGHVCRHNVLKNIGGIGIRSTNTTTRIILVANRVESTTGARYSNLCAAAPTGGTWKAQDIMPNDANAGAGGVIGWVCVIAGTPGTWKSFGSIAA